MVISEDRAEFGVGGVIGGEFPTYSERGVAGGEAAIFNSLCSSSPNMSGCISGIVAGCWFAAGCAAGAGSSRCSR